MDVPIDAKVQCTDGKCGKSTFVIVNPVKRVVTHFVVKDKRFPENPDRLVPVAKIAEISGNQIHLECTRSEVARMEPFTTTRFVQKEEPDYASSYMAGNPNAFTHPTVMWDTWAEPVPEVHIPHDKLAVYRGMDVKTGEGKVGTVDELVADPDSGEITHLLMRKGHLWGAKDVAIPITAIDLVHADEVYLNINNQDVAALPSVPVKWY